MYIFCGSNLICGLCFVLFFNQFMFFFNQFIFCESRLFFKTVLSINCLKKAFTFGVCFKKCDMEVFWGNKEF